MGLIFFAFFEKFFVPILTSGGYVGLSIATLLSQHHKVMAVDIVPEKVELINSKKSPIQDEYIEKYLTEKELKQKKTNRIRIDAIEPEEFSGEWLEHPTATSYPNNLKEESLDGQQIVELKRGSKGRKFLPAAISNLNIQTLGYIGDIPDFRYDTKSKKFYTESSICHERTTTELNQAASALRLFEGMLWWSTSRKSRSCALQVLGKTSAPGTP